MIEDLKFLGIVIVPVLAKTTCMVLHFQNEHRTCTKIQIEMLSSRQLPLGSANYHCACERKFKIIMFLIDNRIFSQHPQPRINKVMDRIQNDCY
jgi:hypothetical protein